VLTFTRTFDKTNGTMNSFNTELCKIDVSILESRSAI